MIRDTADNGRHFFEGCVTENGERRGSALVGKAAAKFFEFFEKRFVVGDLGRKGTLAPRPFLPVFWQFSSERVNEIFLKLFYLLLFHFIKRLDRRVRSLAEKCVPLKYVGMNSERLRIETEEMESRKPAHPRECNIALSVLERMSEVDHCGIHTHSLALVHGHRPRKPKRDLRDLRTHLAVLLNCPFRRRYGHPPPGMRFDDGKLRLFFKIDDSAEGAVHVLPRHAVFGEHDGRATLQLKPLGRETAALQILDKALGARRSHCKTFGRSVDAREAIGVDPVNIGVMRKKARDVRVDSVVLSDATP